ncbi:MAG: DUF1501 domain-containing protein [Gemmataceae bacterium]
MFGWPAALHQRSSTQEALTSRRDILRLGALAPVTGLTLAELFAAEKHNAARRVPARSCILVFMEGGPSHIDLWDMKPHAPPEIRGEFAPIATSVPGLTVCEHLPRLARWMHLLLQIRSVHHTITDHNAGTYYMLTGRYPIEGGRLIVANSPTNFPPYGAVLARLRPAGRPLPEFVHIPEFMSNNGVDIAGQSAGFLGPSCEPFVAGDPSLPDYRIPGLSSIGIADVHLADRVALHRHLDRWSRWADSPAVERMDGLQRRALAMLAAPEVRRAFDLSHELMTIREKYGIDRGSDRSIEARHFGGLPHLGQCMLLARRLIEAGVRLVTVCTGRRIDQAWDTHRQHFPLLKKSLCPYFDRAFAALLEDLHDRGLLHETLVVCMGEFGRTPRLGYVTSGAGAARDGRDHWPYCYTVLLAGAGLPGGTVYGSSDRFGAYPSRDPVTPEDIAATIYHALGVPPDTILRDPQDKPYTLATGRVLKNLWGIP